MNVSGFALIASRIFLIMATGVLGLEALYFLKEGGLLNIPLMDGLEWCGLAWAKEPHCCEWLHHILKHIPLGLTLLFVSIGLFFSQNITNADDTMQ